MRIPLLAQLLRLGLGKIETLLVLGRQSLVVPRRELLRVGLEHLGRGYPSLLELLEPLPLDGRDGSSFPSELLLSCGELLISCASKDLGVDELDEGLAVYGCRSQRAVSEGGGAGD